jgi:DtxR family Mn-dependent transcriptional regulator
MATSSTVENYLKAIYQGVTALPNDQQLLPMGQLAAALEVTPGTATAMVKTLSDSGLVEYEPYSGVTLTAAGQKLAALVLRRHRLIELFLVKVMGFAWDEVHDDAEQLEHAVSDGLVDRMDEMLGRPESDPHGDPIPNSDGLVKLQDVQNLLTCPLHTRVTVTRVLDQNKGFLRFLDRHDLKPGTAIEIEARDQAGDSVQVKGLDDRIVTIGTRAASKLLVQIAQVLVLLAMLPLPSAAQPAPPTGGSAPPFRILDNAFLVEEAFNQEAGIFQNIVGLDVGPDGEWETTFTQEWPLGG